MDSVVGDMRTKFFEVSVGNVTIGFVAEINDCGALLDIYAEVYQHDPAYPKEKQRHNIHFEDVVSANLKLDDFIKEVSQAAK